MQIGSCHLLGKAAGPGREVLEGRLPLPGKGGTLEESASLHKALGGGGESFNHHLRLQSRRLVPMGTRVICDIGPKHLLPMKVRELLKMRT